MDGLNEVAVPLYVGRGGEDYASLLSRKRHCDSDDGFAPVYMPDFLFDFQADLCEWAVLKGRGSLMADCGLGKTPMELVFAENVVRKTNRPVLILTPLAVAAHVVRDAEKFGIGAVRNMDGRARPGINVTNYEKLHLFSPHDFAGVICDESGVLKEFKSVRQRAVTDFMRKARYRLLASATPAPNDHIEFGTASEALGYMGRMDMLGTFFKTDEDTLHPKSFGAKWMFKAHAEERFWPWVVSWARAIRRPSDLGYEDGRFRLPALIEEQHIVENGRPPEDSLFALPAVTLSEQRKERKATLQERCERVADLVRHGDQAVAWCHTNEEGDLLERLIPGAVQVAGDDSDDHKEGAFLDFERGELRVIVTKPTIAGFGLNWQRCRRMTMFPSHSFEQYYQAVRRCWRFGQEQPVKVDLVTTEGETNVLHNLQRKARMADAMYARLITTMNDAAAIERGRSFPNPTEVPAWLS
jgi:hypothetical protein